MLTQAGTLVALLYCLYRVLFRWRRVVGRYGRLSLCWWMTALVVGGTLAGLAADIVLLGATIGPG